MAEAADAHQGSSALLPLPVRRERAGERAGLLLRVTRNSKSDPLPCPLPEYREREARCRRRAGFTLIELLVAGMILAMAVAVIATGVSNSYGALSDARDERRASCLLDDLLTKVDMIGPARIASEGPHDGQFDGADARFSWTVDVSNRAEGHLYEVTATISWATSPGHERRAIVHTYLNDPPNSHDPTVKWRDL